MRSAVAPLVLLLTLAGCAGTDPRDEDAESTNPSPTAPAPRQLVEHQGNTDQCTEVLRDPVRIPFEVVSGYDRLEVSFHASGLGQVGYTLRGPGGVVVDEVADHNPGNQPCSHAHAGGSKEHAASPGAYEIEVRNVGILGWHLLVNERASANATA